MTNTAPALGKNETFNLARVDGLTKRRLLYLDNLRMALITAIVVGHMSVTYGVVASWYYYEIGEVSPIPYSFIMLAAGVGLGFAIGLFFMIAGYFTPGTYDYKGASQFMMSRLRRLGIPLLIFGILINPLVHYAVDSHGGDCLGSLYDCQFQGTFWQYMLEYPGNIGSLADGPVWFLAALIIFSTLYTLWRLTIRHFSLGTDRIEVKTPGVPNNLAIALFALAIGILTFFVRFKFKAFEFYEPFHLEYGRMPQYICLFTAGIFAYRGNWLPEFSNEQGKIWRWIALVCIVTLPILMVPYGALAGNLDERVIGGVNWLSFSYSIWEGFLAVSMVITLLVWFRGRFDRQGRVAKAMSEAAFGVYIIHPAVIVPFALLLSPLKMNLSLKFIIVTPIAVALTYLVVYALRKIPLIRRVFG